MFSGVFAGLIVSIVAEVLKFYGTKSDKELLLYNYLVNIYIQLNIAKIQIDHCFSDINRPVNGTLLQFLSNVIEQVKGNIGNIDYSYLFCVEKSKNVESIINDFKINEESKLMILATDCKYLELAVAVDSLNSGNPYYHPTATSQNTQKTLLALKEEIQMNASVLSKYLQDLDNCFPNRFHWKELNKSLSSLPYSDTLLEDFWKRFNVS